MVIRRLCAHYSQITNAIASANTTHISSIISCNVSNSQTVKLSSQSKHGSKCQAGKVSFSQLQRFSSSKSGTVTNSQSGRISNSQSKTVHSNEDSQSLLFQSSIRNEIMKHTELTRDHLTPEIQLHLVTRQCELWHSRGDNSPFVDPFWAFFWPGGQAVTRYILDNHDKFRHKKVLDVGSGCGASAIAASQSGAKTVVANDIDAAATVAAKLNADVNLCDITVDSRNLIGSVCNQWDVIILGDMFYDSEFVSCISDWLSHHLKAGTCVLIGDPGRMTFENHPMRSQLTKLAEYELPEQSRLENNGLNTAGVWRVEVGT